MLTGNERKELDKIAEECWKAGLGGFWDINRIAKRIPESLLLRVDSMDEAVEYVLDAIDELEDDWNEENPDEQE